jgi:predicted Zn-dependent protease
MLGNEDEAKKWMHVVQSERKSAVAVALLRALSWRNQNKRKEAVEELDAAVLQEPNSAELWLELGKLHWEDERYDLSLAALLQVDRIALSLCAMKAV